ncbi:DUF72 domain-containing protein [Caulobacter endophyticus]|uniref:DUF72 domain-containing protein n=1 Tax=Caulobacter endophyticus TaxID=2172652 RepID=A0A2T9JGY8_9CAUL|nr:DUF72 domain-containing protein [Caulobacter endophyticus]PVM82964.1 DUF72 domain-containing protein [Caulobacter endophyticus]
MEATARIGCSGWTYDDWRGPFYPETVRLKDRLAYYASVFDTTEINGSFYRLPSEKAVNGWADQVPDTFLFAWKVSRYITHNKKLKDCQDSVDLVFGRMAPLGDKRGPALVQLPPMLRRDDERLKRFLSWIPRGEKVTVEFRHDSWYDAGVLDILRDHGAAFCISDHHDAPSPWEVTADFAYVRGHGPGGRYHGRYTANVLDDWARWIDARLKDGIGVFSYFDNDIKSAAPQDARLLIQKTSA